MVWGEVHDENSWALGGVAGHAGVFSTADDLAILCQTLLNGGHTAAFAFCARAPMRMALVNYNALSSPHRRERSGLGFQLSTSRLLGPLVSPVTFGHTGYTGTSVVIDPLSHSFLVLLANRVHPDRNWGTNTVDSPDAGERPGVRHARAPAGRQERLARRPRETRHLQAHSSVVGSGAMTPLPNSSSGTTRIRVPDTVRFETSTDTARPGRPTQIMLSWAGPTMDGRRRSLGYGGRHWWRVSPTFPDGTTDMRWSSPLEGRGPT